MSAAARLPAIAGTVGAGAALALLASHPTVRRLVEINLGAGTASKMWKLAAAAFALVNLKNLPGFWHIRVLRGILYQLYFQPAVQQPRHLFAPLVTSSYNTLYDCDYNFHKSNSTYFADLDVARAHTVGLLIRTGLARLNKGDEEGLPVETRDTKGKYFVALGAVSCFFQKQIEPLQAFDIYTRVLSWDRKWLYLVSHIVEKGAVQPDSYVLQPWKKGKRKAAKDERDLRKHIFATSVARYVFKKGRLTVSPEIILERSRLLPPRPAGVGFPPRAEDESGKSTSTATPATPAESGLLTSAEKVATEVSSRLDTVAEQKASDDEWTWDDMEAERIRGLNLAVHFDKMSAVHNELRAGDVLGQYGDYW